MSQHKSEKASVTWGESQKESRKMTLTDMVGYDDSGIYTIKTKRSGFISTIILEHFNNQMNPVKSVEMDLKYQKKDKSFEFIIQLHNELFLFTSFKNQKLKRNYLFVQGIDKKSLRPKNDLKKIAEIDYKGKWEFNAGNFEYELSRDSSKVLIYYNLPHTKGEPERFGFHVFDDQMVELWEKQVTLPVKDELFGVEDFEVANGGDVYLLGMVFKDIRCEKKQGKPNYQYQILSYLDKGEQYKEYPVKIEVKFLTDMLIAINTNQDIVCAGFYSDEGTYSIKGSFFLRINGETKEISTKSFKEFGIDFVNQNMTDRQEKKTKKKAAKGKYVELYKYDLDRIILRADGGAALVGEQYFIRVSTMTTSDANGGTHTTTVYYYIYNDIIVINTAPDGTIDWTEKIPKKQVTRNDGGFFSSYTMAVVDDKLYFLFNDNPKNLFYKGSGKIYNFNKSKESLVVMVELDAQGKQSREALFSVKESDILTRPMVCEQISKDELVLFGQRKKTHRFAKLTFKP